MRRAGAAGVALLALGGCGVSAAGRPRAAPAVQANRSDTSLPLTRDDEAPSLVVDRREPSTAYLAEVEMDRGACRFYVSTDHGATWRSEAAPSLEPYTQDCAMGSAQPQGIRTELQQGPDGTLYYVFQGSDPSAGGTRSVLLGRSSDGGRSWRTVAIDAGPNATQPGEVEVNFAAHLAVDPSRPGRLYAMWRRSYPRVDPVTAPTPTRPYLSISDDAGATWGPAQLMFDRTSGTDGPRPVVVGGRLFAFWRESAPPVPVVQEGPSARAPVTRVLVSVSSDEGRTWVDSEIASADDASDPAPVYDRRRGRFGVVWHDNRSGDLDVYFSGSADGVTWTTPVRLNDDPPGTRVGQYFPQISSSASGRLDVAWYDWRDDPFPPPTVGNGQTLGLFSDRGVFASVYLTSSRDGGRSWTRNLRVNDVPIDRTIGSWENNRDVMAPVALASSSTGAIVAWSDTRNGNTINQTQDIVTSTVTFGKLQAGKVTPFQTGVAGLLLGFGIAMCLAAWLVRRRPPLRSSGGPMTPRAGQTAAHR